MKFDEVQKKKIIIFLKEGLPFILIKGTKRAGNFILIIKAVGTVNL